MIIGSPPCIFLSVLNFFYLNFQYWKWRPLVLPCCHLRATYSCGLLEVRAARLSCHRFQTEFVACLFSRIVLDRKENCRSFGCIAFDLPEICREAQGVKNKVIPVCKLGLCITLSNVRQSMSAIYWAEVGCTLALTHSIPVKKEVGSPNWLAYQPSYIHFLSMCANVVCFSFSF